MGCVFAHIAEGSRPLAAKHGPHKVSV
jgi:hypothetical protein